MNSLESILLGVVQWSREKTANVRVAGVRLTPDEAKRQIKELFEDVIDNTPVGSDRSLDEDELRKTIKEL